MSEDRGKALVREEYVKMRIRIYRVRENRNQQHKDDHQHDKKRALLPALMLKLRVFIAERGRMNVLHLRERKIEGTLEVVEYFDGLHIINPFGNLDLSGSLDANGGRTIIEKIEHYTDFSYAIVLYTSCDEGRRHGDRAWRPRVRQNVVYEHGYLGCKLGRGHVAALVDENVELPSDCSGVVYISRGNAQWKSELAREMREADLRFDPTRIAD